MEVKPTVHKSNFFPIYETEAMADYFSDMASKGLFIESLGPENQVPSFYFYRAEPKKLRYTVDVFIDHQNRFEYIEYCRATGWDYDCCNFFSNLYIFHTENPETPPLQTDPKIYAECLKDTALKRAKTNAVTLSVLTVFLLAGAILHFMFNGSLYLYENGNSYTLKCVTSLLFLLSTCLYSIFNYRRLRKKVFALEHNLAVKKPSNKKRFYPAKIFNSPYLLYLMFYPILLLSIIFSSITWKSSDWQTSTTIPGYASFISLEKLNAGPVYSSGFSTEKPSIYIKEYYIVSQNEFLNKATYRLSVNCYRCNFPFVANRIYKVVEEHFSITAKLSESECRDLNLSNCKYGRRQENATTVIILQDENDVYIIELDGFLSFDDNIKSVIRNAMAKQQ